MRRVRDLAVLSMILVATSCVGFTSTITPPTAPADPVSVIVVSEVMHRGLLFPREPSGRVDLGYLEFGFGEWEWFARGNDAWYRAFPTVLWSTRATLARREHAGRDVLELKDSMPWARFQELRVERNLAVSLRDRLQAKFEAGKSEEVAQSDQRLAFVPDDSRGYWWAHNCADAVADWLVELGCTVSWCPIRLDLVVL